MNLKPDKLKSLDHDHAHHEVIESGPTLDSTGEPELKKRHVPLGKGNFNKQNEKIIESMFGRDKKFESPFEFKRVKSKSSCKVDDITSFVFGGFSSRFWLLRKHVNSMSLKELNNLPFFVGSALH